MKIRAILEHDDKSLLSRTVTVETASTGKQEQVMAGPYRTNAAGKDARTFIDKLFNRKWHVYLGKCGYYLQSTVSVPEDLFIIGVQRENGSTPFVLRYGREEIKLSGEEQRGLREFFERCVQVHRLQMRKKVERFVDEEL